MEVVLEALFGPTVVLAVVEALPVASNPVITSGNDQTSVQGVGMGGN